MQCVAEKQSFRLQQSVLLLFAVAAGMSVANIYYAQPLLDSIAREFGFHQSSAGSIVTVTQCGYAAGLLFIVPLGDILNRRRLVVSQLCLSAMALVLIGFARTREILFVGFFFVGLFAVVVQVLVAYAASLAQPERRGSAVGTVTSGVVIGILLARTVAGALSDAGSWRLVYGTSAVLTLSLAYALSRVLPMTTPEVQNSYTQLLRSTFALYRTTPVLRIRAAIAFFLFAAFSTLWASMVLPLRTSPHPLSHTAVGSIGLVGLAGAIAAGRAGHLADQGRGQQLTGISLAVLFASWIFIGCLHSAFPVFLLGVVLLDFAVQAVHVTNQSLIFAARPEAKSRLVAAYMVFYSLGSGVGAIASTKTYGALGWLGVSILGACFSATALLLWAFTLHRQSKSEYEASPSWRAGEKRVMRDL